MDKQVWYSEKRYGLKILIDNRWGYRWDYLGKNGKVRGDEGEEEEQRQKEMAEEGKRGERRERGEGRGTGTD